MKVIASWQDGLIRVYERDTGWVVSVHKPGKNPVRIGRTYTSRGRAVNAAEAYADGPQDNPTVGG